MKINTVDDLQELVDGELAWRRKELTAIKSNIALTKKYNKIVSLRSGITLLYAHWEGFIKNVAMYYLCFVDCRRLKYCQLTNNFLAIGVNTKLKRFEETRKASIHNNIVENILDHQNEKAIIPYDVLINTESNLNSEVFKEIMETIGLSYSDYECNFKMLDEVLLNMRNKIAHGENIDHMGLDEERFGEIYTNITNMMSWFSNQICNAATTKAYMKNA